jgi:hypothetical protein
MKYILLPLFLLGSTFTNSIYAQDLTAQIQFHKIIVSSGILIQITRSEKYSVEIKKQDVEDKCLVNTLENGVLTLKLVSGFSCKGKVVVNISCPELKEIEIMGKAEVTTENILTGDSMLITMKSGGKAYLDMDVRYLDARLSGGAVARCEGYAVNQSISISTSSIFSGWELEGENVIINAASSAIGKVYAHKEIQATAGSGGYIGIKGNPAEKKIDSKSNGEIEILEE